jgi:carboxyl-terminal processing protease
VDQIVSFGPKLKGVILDVRNNPGGYLSGSVFIASEFLAKGVIVKQETSDGKTETFSVDPKEKKGKLLSVPLVVLVNEGSASASEIVAGALQHYGRAKVVGQKTFGKGTIQEAQDIGSEGSGLHVTTARWLLPGGENVDKKGILPDVEVAMDEKDTEHDLQLEKAIELLR